MNNHNIAAALSDFLFASPTPFHAVKQAKILLQQAGFCQLYEQDVWDFGQNGQPFRGFFCARGGSLIAWICGANNVCETGLQLAAAHTDSPALKLKLESAHFDSGVLACHVSVCGSPIFATHTDRSLAVAGIAVSSQNSAGTTPLLRYIHSGKAVALLPNLAIHLNREANTKLSYNAQTELKVIFCEQLEGQTDTAAQLLRQKLGLAKNEVCDLQLCSSDKPQLIGLNDEFFTGARLDDMTMVYLLLSALQQGLGQKNIQKWPVAILCNGEEIGSGTYEGAASNFVSSVLQRIAGDGAERISRAMARSFCLSLDGAHASQPAYPAALDPNYTVRMGGGPAIKLPANASYSSEPFGIASIQAMAGQVNCHLQNAVPRSDKSTGSTIGPILCSRLGVRGVDIGLPMYAMHSLQETVSLRDYCALQKLVHGYYYETCPSA